MASIYARAWRRVNSAGHDAADLLRSFVSERFGARAGAPRHAAALQHESDHAGFARRCVTVSGAPFHIAGPTVSLLQVDRRRKERVERASKTVSHRLVVEEDDTSAWPRRLGVDGLHDRGRHIGGRYPARVAPPVKGNEHERGHQHSCHGGTKTRWPGAHRAGGERGRNERAADRRGQRIQVGTIRGEDREGHESDRPERSEHDRAPLEPYEWEARTRHEGDDEPGQRAEEAGPHRVFGGVVEEVAEAGYHRVVRRKIRRTEGTAVEAKRDVDRQSGPERPG